MYKSAVFALFVTGFCSACSFQKGKQSKLNLQIKISGTGLTNFETQVYSRGRQEFLMAGDPAQEIRFRNSDTINYFFPLGKKDASGHLDTTSIGRDETLSFDFIIKENKRTQFKNTDTKPILHISLLSNGKAVETVELPAVRTIHSKAVARDSTASLVIYTGLL